MLKSMTRAGAAALLLSGAAFAQEDDAQPTRSSESYDQWTVECNTIKSGEEETRRICEVVQVFTNQQTNSEVARLAFAYNEEKELMMFLRTFVDISFETKPAVVVDEATSLEGDWVRCRGKFCYAQFETSDESLTAFKNTNSAKLRFPISSGQALQINIGGRGVTAALNALAEK